ncbi:Hexaprenyldihydroxybenzoate methyltransferase, mitochondrial [Dinochytrium kinnereticum]|nr:Hexaprenyldihydroxybenzoate methyltransferase, mitochondrial [Dinochytrium kinnereticum]
MARNFSGAVSSIDPAEVEKFGRAAAEWWDPKGQFEMLHRMNPVRVRYIKDKVDQFLGKDKARSLHKPFTGLKMLDVGCGGGLLSESLSRLGGEVTGLDAAPENVKMAAFHAQADPLLVSPNYRAVTAEELLEETGGSCFDVVCSLEVIEHVNDPKSFVNTLSLLVKVRIFRFEYHLDLITAASQFFTVFMAEDVLKWVPPGTHEHGKYVTPEELTSYAAVANASVLDMSGMAYNPLGNRWHLIASSSPAALLMNYLACLKRNDL